MQNKEYLNFLAVLVYNHRAKHTWVILISSLLIMIIASFLFVKSSIHKETFSSIQIQPDFIVQKYRAGNVQDMPNTWMDDFVKIEGVESVEKRVYGLHYYEPLETHFMIVGIDFSQDNTQRNIKKFLPTLDINDFLSRNNMIIGHGVKKFFDTYEYKDNYNFRPPDRSIEKVYFHSELPLESQIVTNDMILMDINLARTILGIDKEYSTDMAIHLEDDKYVEDVRISLILSHFDMRIISKLEVQKYYEKLFNYKGGVFLALYIITLVTFMLILYQRYTNITHNDAREIAILRISGWKISDVIWLKLSENFLIALVSYMFGVVVAYVYVFVLGAPLIRDIFLGYQNLQNNVTFVPSVDISSLVLIFLLFIIPFMLVILIPVYKIAITEPVEVMR